MSAHTGPGSVAQLFDMTGQVALLAGAGRGIGAASALALAEAGADVAVVARSSDQLDDVAAAARAHGVRALPVPCDSTDPDAFAGAVATVIDEFGRLDTVVNVVGGWGPSAFQSTTADDLRGAFDLNVVSAIGVVNACLTHLSESDNASITVVSSAIGSVTGRGWLAYGTAKGALNHAVRLAACDLNPSIRINAVAPGAIWTDALSSIATDDAIIAQLTGATPLRRIGLPEEVAAAVLYLASRAGAFMTGQILAVDGGLRTTNMEMPFPDL